MQPNSQETRDPKYSICYPITEIIPTEVSTHVLIMNIKYTNIAFVSVTVTCSSIIFKSIF